MNGEIMFVEYDSWSNETYTNRCENCGNHHNWGYIEDFPERYGDGTETTWVELPCVDGSKEEKMVEIEIYNTTNNCPLNDGDYMFDGEYFRS